MKSQRSLRSINSQGGERSKVQLPKISEARPSTVGNEVFENPFYVPPDEEVFKIKNQELEQKEIEKQRVKGLKIWQKGIKNQSEGKLRKITELTNFEDENEDKDGKLNIVEAAKSAIKNRIRHKEPLIDFLNKKREMFLFQMSINEKKEQIKEFEELAYLQEISLQNSKELLEKDAETFKQHIEKNKNETRQAIKNAEDEGKFKQKKIQDMKKTQDELSTLMSQNMKDLEKLEKFFGYKTFLDSLTPDEFKNFQKKRKEDKRLGNKEQGSEFKWQIYNMNLSPGILEYLNDDDDDGEMYFKRPDQLQEYFENLEEKNLFIIKHAQDIEKSLEDVKHNFKLKEKDLLERKGLLERNKEELLKAIKQRGKTINQLDHVKDDKFTEDTLSDLERKIREIYETSKIFKEGKGEPQVNGLEILRMIERKLDTQLKELKQLPPQKVLEQYRVCINQRREAAAEQKKIQAEEDERKKREIIKKRLMAQKRSGRPIMAKSMLKKEDKAEAVQAEEDIEEIERKLYFVQRFQ